MTESYRHFHLDTDDKGVVWLGIEVVGKSVNILMSEVLKELACITEGLAKAPPSGFVLYSRMERGFIFGADINEFADFKDEQSIATHIGWVLESFQQIEDLPCPTAILIDGICVGGGFELALAFDRIIATESSQVGFPEVKLGLLPGYGGSGRALARMGLEPSVDLVLTGRSVNGHDALEMGAVDHLVADKAELISAGQLVMEGKIDRQLPKICDDPEQFIAEQRTKISLKARVENTPAPFAILDHYAQNDDNKNNVIKRETKLFSRLMLTPASVGLRRAFHLNDIVKKGGRGDPRVSRVHVIGAGVMGGDIAAVAALSGFHVTLQDVKVEAIESAIARAQTLFERRLKSSDKVTTAMGRLVADPEGDGLVDADLLIEAVAENLSIKQSVFAAAEAKMKSDAIMATNTSAIPLEDIGEVLTAPGRLIGMHFFNPVPVLPLVEIVYTAKSDPSVVERAMFVSGSLRKQPIKCKSSPGFLVNRALIPYVFKAIDDVLEGANPDMLDEAMVRYGMPMGPIELADQIGLDVCHDAGMVLGISKASERHLKDMMAKGTIGRKSGSGFYQWSDKKAERPRALYDDDELNRLALELLAPLVKECEAAVAEGVVDSIELADAACLFGVGYPAHTGGPIFSHGSLTN